MLAVDPMIVTPEPPDAAHVPPVPPLELAQMEGVFQLPLATA